MFLENEFAGELEYGFERRKHTMAQKNLEVTAPEREWFVVMGFQIYLDHLLPGGFLTSKQNISLTFKTDGVHVFKAPREEIWPLLVMINELHPSVRYSIEYPYLYDSLKLFYSAISENQLLSSISLVNTRLII